jgi:hypothetical protein
VPFPGGFAAPLVLAGAWGHDAVHFSQLRTGGPLARANGTRPRRAASWPVMSTTGPAAGQAAADAGDDPAVWPDDRLVGYEGVARLTGLRPATLSNYLSKSRGRPAETRLIPAPEEYPGAVADRPRWRVGTIREWMANRPGRGSPGRPRPSRTRGLQNS